MQLLPINAKPIGSAPISAAGQQIVSLVVQAKEKQLAKIENWNLPGRKWLRSAGVLTGFLQRYYSIGTEAESGASRQKAGKGLINSANILLGKKVGSEFTWNTYLLQAGARLKQLLTAFLFSNLPEPASTLYAQILLGRTDQRSEKLYQSFKITGTQHIAVVSGFNLTFLARLATISLQPLLKRKQVALMVFLLLIVYCSAVGFEPSVTRAFVMTSLSLCAGFYFHRQYRPRYSLIVAFVLLLAIDSSLATSVSFQLSFAASAAIIFVLPKIDRTINRLAEIEAGFVTGKKVMTATKKSIFSTVSALSIDGLKLGFAVQLAVAPLLLYHFKETNLLSFLASGAVFWLPPMIFSYGWILIAAGALKMTAPGVVSGIISLLFASGNVLAELAVASLNLLSRIPLRPLASESFGINSVIAWYIMLITIIVYYSHRTRKPARLELAI